MKRFLALFVLLVALFALVSETKAGGRVVFRSRGFGGNNVTVFRSNGFGGHHVGAQVFFAPPVVVEQRVFGGFGSFSAFGHCGF